MIRSLTLVAAIGGAIGPVGAEVLGDPSAWRNDQPRQPSVLVVRNATIWTSAEAGRIENADLLIRGGKVVSVGKQLTAPAGAEEIDATGKHVTPGLIDAHSHAAITGGVNEGTNITTAEVRIADVVDAESVDLYRQLAGGVTTANLMHGSANSIGGQTAIIKLRWGQPPAQLLLDNAYPGIKFALGENPKQSNWNVDQRRYPQTRPGVEQSIRERFRAALDYRREWAEFRASNSPKAVPPRRDLQLEAILEILDGERGIQAHSYRADEIIMLMRIAEDFGFTVQCFQHVLEGYKVADELAAHGAGASTFSDWWAYKFEVIDAIPYNGAIMWKRGVVVSFNSDSSELARRLNLEAAKAVRYGGVPESEALEFVTINPAIQLGVDDRVGSLEPGKDADFVIWSDDPLSSYSIVEQTWVDGRRYFDRGYDLARREAVAAERTALLAKAKSYSEKPTEAEEAEASPSPEESDTPGDLEDPEVPEDSEDPEDPEDPADPDTEPVQASGGDSEKATP